MSGRRGVQWIIDELAKLYRLRDEGINVETTIRKLEFLLQERLNGDETEQADQEEADD